MAYAFKQIEAHDPSNPGLVAPNASVTIFEPGDPTKTPLTLTTLAGDPLPNPVTVNGLGYGPAFMHATLPQVAWAGGGLTGTFESYEGMRDEAVAARTAAETAAATAGADAVAELEARIAAGDFKGNPGTDGADGSNVLPTDEAIADAINGTGTATKAALDAAYALKGEVPTSPGVTFVTLTSVGQALTVSTDPVVGLALVQGGTGSKTVAWPAGIRWDGGTVPTLSTAAGSVDVVTLVADGSGGWLGKLDGRYAAPADTTVPSAVTGLTAGTATDTTIPLSWTAATDNIGVAGYEYSTNGTTYTSTGSTGTTYTVTGLAASTAYTLHVRAFDAAGNRGAAASVSKTTAATTQSYKQAVAALSPTYFYALEDPAGTTTPAQTGSGSTTTTVAGTTTFGEPGIGAGSTASLKVSNASAGGVSLPSTGVFDGASAVSFMAVVKVETLPAGVAGIVGKNLATKLYFSSTGRMSLQVNDNANIATNDTHPLAAGTSYVVGFTYDGTTLKLFRNGVLAQSVACTGPVKSSAYPTYIGGVSSMNGGLGGWIYGAGLWVGTALTDAQMLQAAQAASL